MQDNEEPVERLCSYAARLDLEGIQKMKQEGNFHQTLQQTCQGKTPYKRALETVQNYHLKVNNQFLELLKGMSEGEQTKITRIVQSIKKLGQYFSSEASETSENRSEYSSNNILEKISRLEEQYQSQNQQVGGRKPARDSHFRKRYRRARNPKVDELYRSFVQKIMDALKVDENTARLYRSAIKIILEREKPELRKNDALKVEEMAHIIDNKDLLEDKIKSIDIEEIKKYMEERRKESEARRKQFRERHSRSPERTRPPETVQEEHKPEEHQDVKISDAPESEKSDTEKPDTKKRRGKRSTTLRTKGPGGYLDSDDILFSPK
jgi:hypothetical protein